MRRLIICVIALFIFSACEDEVAPVVVASSYGAFPFSFSTLDLHGNPVTEESLGQKELFFVYFWTTWCPSCVRAIPGLEELAQEFSDRVGFLTLLGDFTANQATAISITEGTSFITVDANIDDFFYLMELLDSGFVPTSAIIGAEGMIGEQIVGGSIDRFRAAIEEVLAE